MHVDGSQPSRPASQDACIAVEGRCRRACPQYPRSWGPSSAAQPPLHRVNSPIVDGSIRRRRDAAFCHDGNIDTLPTCLGDGSPYPPITMSEHIRVTLAGSCAGVANTEAEREVARVLAAQTGA